MRFLPIVGRELRAKARANETYRLRFWNAGIAAALLGLILLQSIRFIAPGFAGQIALYALALLGLLFCLCEGVRNTADAISSERRAGTLELLVLTPLKAFDILAGKLASTSLQSSGAFIATFPILALPLLAGSVTFAEVGRIALMWSAALLLSLAAGLFVSAQSVREDRALATALGIILGLLVLPVAVDFLRTEPNDWPNNPLLSIPSPAVACYYAFAAPYRTYPEVFWLSIVLQLSMAVLLLIFASRSLSRAWQETPPRQAALQALLRREISWKSSARTGLAPPSRWLEDQPIAWIALRRKDSGFFMLILSAIAAATALWLSQETTSSVRMPMFQLLQVLFKAALVSYAGWRAAHWLNEALHLGALELILTSELTDAQIVEGCRLALSQLLLAPFVVALIAQAASWFSLITPGYPAEITENAPALFANGLANLLLNLYAVSWASLWFAVLFRSVGKSVLGAFTLVVLAPLAAIAGLQLALTLLHRPVTMRPPLLAIEVVAWIMPILFKIGVVWWMRKRLLESLRKTAASR